jgi:cytochrome c nitrite reductase small subunit
MNGKRTRAARPFYFTGVRAKCVTKVTACIFKQVYIRHILIQGAPMSKTLFIIVIAAAVISLGYFVLVTDATAYGGSDPATCANCHVMDSQYENWYHGGHEKWAKCTDCHLPHDNFVVYYAEKGRQGAKDTYAFVTDEIPIAIRANEKTKGIIQENCIHCHEDAVEDIMMAGGQPIDRYCWDCHRNIAHGARGASPAPYQDSTLYPTK